MEQTLESRVTEIAAVVRGLRLHDVSPTLSPNLPLFFPMPHVQVESIAHRDPGVDTAVAANMWTLPEHAGAHVDAPYHFSSTGATVDDLPVDTLFFKQYKKFDLKPLAPQPGEPISKDELLAAAERDDIILESGDIAIVEFGWDQYLPGGRAGKDVSWWGLHEPGLTDDACEYLAAAGVTAVGCDTSACDFSFSNGEMKGGSGHTRWFLPSGILIIEGLTGLASAPASGLFAALPLKLEKGTGSPLRVVLLST